LFRWGKLYRVGGVNFNGGRVEVVCVKPSLASSGGPDDSATEPVEAGVFAVGGGRVSGRGLVAWIFIATAVVLVGALGAGGIVVAGALRGQGEASARQRASATARTLAAAATELVKDGELSTLRRMLPDLVRESALSEIAISLPDGQIIAHSEPSRISMTRLPEKWSASAVDEAMVGGTDTVLQSMNIPGRGALVLTVRAEAPLVAIDGQTLTALGAIAFVATLALFGVYRRAAGPLNTLGMIGGALRDAEKCGGDWSLLRIDERRGAEAMAWNVLLLRAEGGGSPGRGADEPLATSDVRRDDGSLAVPMGMGDLEQAVNILPTGVMIVDWAGKVRHVNNMAAMLTGGAREKVLGRELIDLLPGDETAQLCAAMAEGGMPRRTLEIKKSTPTGEAVLRVHCRPLRKDDEGAALIIIEDVTQQRTADASRNLFIAQATHELRTPLTNMRLALEELTDGDAEALPELAAGHVNMVQTEVRRLERIVSEMLAVAEIEAGSLKLNRSEVKLDRLMAEIEADHSQHAAKAGIDLKVEMPPKLPTLVGDREKLAQAIHNIVGNAVKYTPAGGKVRIVVGETAGGGVSFTVTDTGMGISAEDQAKLFNRFVRGSDPRVAGITGTGLGLALSKEIARLHGGDIILHSELDKGSTFTLTVPGGRQAERRAA